MAEPEFVDDTLMRLGALEFHYEHPLRRVPEGRFPVEKPRELLEDYVAMCADVRPRRIVELGINQGGSTAFLTELVQPEKLVAIELSDRPVPALARYIDEQGAGAVVRPNYEVDQADRARVGAIVADEFAGAPLDLVIDDASHLYAPSRVSFETLFPHLRPGGLYVLEDWRWQHQVVTGMLTSASNDSLSDRARAAITARMQEMEAGTYRPETPMSRLTLELVVARAASGDVIGDLTIGHYWTTVRRGPADLDPATFRLDDLEADHFRLLAPEP